MKSVRPCVLLRLAVAISLALCASALPLSCVTAAEGQARKVVEAEGTAVVINGDVAIARDNAVSDALRKSVEQAVGLFLSPDRIVENFEVIRDNVYSKSEGYVENYTIRDEKADEGLYIVSVLATVSLQSIDNDLDALGLLAVRKGLPRVMVIITEKSAATGGEFAWDPATLSIAEEVIRNRFLKDGFTFVDRAVLTETAVFPGVDLADAEAAEWGSRIDAELVIAGKALARSAGTVAGTAMRSFQATVTARAVRTDSGVTIASANAHGAAVHIDAATGEGEAIKKASEEVAETLRSQIVAKWQEDVSTSMVVAMTVKGITSCADFVRFRNMLKGEIRGVKNIYQRSMKSGQARLDVEIQGTAQSLADELAIKETREFSLDITGVTQNSVEVFIAK